MLYQKHQLTNKNIFNTIFFHSQFIFQHQVYQYSGLQNIGDRLLKSTTYNMFDLQSPHNNPDSVSISRPLFYCVITVVLTIFTK